MFHLINKDLLFGLDEAKSPDYYISVTIKTDGEGHCSNAPCIARYVPFAKGEGVTVIHSFPYRSGAMYPNYRAKYHATNLIAKPYGCFINKHEFALTTSFDLDYMKVVMEQIERNGAVSLIMTKRAALSFLKKFESIINRYKYYSTFYSMFNELYNYEIVPKDRIVPVITFLGIHNCIPIFNTKKVDGIGIIYRMVLPLTSKKKGALISPTTLAVVLSNFRENLFYVDGTEVHRFDPITKETMHELEKATKAWVGRKGQQKKKKEDGETWVSNDGTTSSAMSWAEVSKRYSTHNSYTITYI